MATRKIPKGYNNKKVDEFLSELSALTKKFGIAIHGCGHCGSPIIYGLENSPSLPHGFGYANLITDEKTFLYTKEYKCCVWI
jgi:hypothetical protein